MSVRIITTKIKLFCNLCKVVKKTLLVKNLNQFELGTKERVRC